ncbi:MAG: NAD(P)H-dependent glycerol-3-phosphate dehydrogenase, partial [Solirubrobacteraceae bacterium]
VFLGVPSLTVGDTIRGLADAGLGPRTPVISLAKGLTPPDGVAPTVLLRERFGESRVACIAGPAHAHEMVSEGAALVAASTNEELARALSGVFMRAGVVCEQSNDPIGVELAGAAKNAAALAAGATEAQGLNAAGAAAGHIFAEVWRYAQAQGARSESLLGLAGTGDLVATVLAPQSRNRRAGELLGQGVPRATIGDALGQSSEAMDGVGLLAQTLRREGVPSPTLDRLAALVEGRIDADTFTAAVTAPGGRFRRRGAAAAPLATVGSGATDRNTAQG